MNLFFLFLLLEFFYFPLSLDYFLQNSNPFFINLCSCFPKFLKINEYIYVYFFSFCCVFSFSFFIDINYILIDFLDLIIHIIGSISGCLISAKSRIHIRPLHKLLLYFIKNHHLRLIQVLFQLYLKHCFLIQKILFDHSLYSLFYYYLNYYH